MKEEKQDLLLDVVHPFVMDLTKVLEKHAERANKLKEDEKISYLKIVEELTDVLINAYRKDVMKTAENLEISSLMRLINIYLNIGFGKVNEVEKVV